MSDAYRYLTPVDFKGANASMTKPEDWEEGSCNALPCYREQGIFLSCWRMGFLARVIALFTGKVYVKIIGSGHPVIGMEVSRKVPYLTGDTEKDVMEGVIAQAIGLSLKESPVKTHSILTAFYNLVANEVAEDDAINSIAKTYGVDVRDIRKVIEDHHGQEN